MDLYWTDTSYDKDYIESMSLEDLADHIETVRQALEKSLGNQYSKIVVLGHSAYGFLCLEYALHYKEHLYGIINVCTPPYFKEESLQTLQTEYMDANFGPKAPGGKDQRWVDYYHYKECYEKSLKEIEQVSKKD